MRANEFPSDVRSDLALMYFPTFDRASGRLIRFALTPTRIRHFRVNRGQEADARWLDDAGAEFPPFAVQHFERQRDNGLVLRWG
jgi:hypothetical protein